MTQTIFEAAAFGDEPGCWPLPAATTPRERWLRAVAAGGQGRYGIATAELAAVTREVAAGPVASVAHSTHASFIRQLGGHVQARRWDGRAMALAADDPEAQVDALLGLAADALGVCRFAASAALLDRARVPLEGATAARLPLRWQWVSAELAMACAEGAAAVWHAECAVELAAEYPSERHRVKTQVVYAAALCSAGRVGEARVVAEDAYTATDTLRLTPLRWALASLLADIADDPGQARRLISARNVCAEQIRRAGGVWRR